MTIKFYCEVCEKDQPTIIEEMKADELNLDGRPWGDIVCKECHFVIATISADKPGKYEFVRRGLDIWGMSIQQMNKCESNTVFVPVIAEGPIRR